jgi:hypothetical protein
MLLQQGKDSVQNKPNISAMNNGANSTDGRYGASIPIHSLSAKLHSNTENCELEVALVCLLLVFYFRKIESTYNPHWYV